ncbi:restriction endonuclease subunit R, partial [Mesorhizobium sp. M2A.F.Ca.ET.017.03.2.1]
ADLSIGQGGVEATERDKNSGMIVTIEEGDIALPDVLTDLQDRTQLTRKSLVRILTECGRLKDFKRNPQAFIEIAGEVINRTKRLALVDGIKYQRIGDEHYYAQELFQQEELTGYLRNMLKDATKSVFEHVVYDSGGVERTFAEQLEKNESVKIYAKLPAWFKVPTPLGTYNPDWAVLVEVSGEERLYFVIETKGSLFTDDLRDNEAAKIMCGEAHFKALEIDPNPARYIKATKIDDLMERC